MAMAAMDGVEAGGGVGGGEGGGGGGGEGDGDVGGEGGGLLPLPTWAGSPRCMECGICSGTASILPRTPTRHTELSRC